MPNAIAYLALFIFPLVAAILFYRLSLLKAAGLTLLLGYLFLPEKPQINLPVLPPFDKNSIPAASALFFAFLKMRAERRNAGMRDRQAPSKTLVRGQDGPPTEGSSPAVQRRSLSEARIGKASVTGKSDKLAYLILLVLLLSPIVTYLTNRMPAVFGPLTLPAIRPYDIMAMSLSFMVLLAPFLVGWLYFRRPEASHVMLRLLAYCGLVYAFFVLFEVRMSPQLNTWIYGFFPHSFAQHMRAGGFRPIVFLVHGLRVGIFLSFAIISAMALMRYAPTPKARVFWAGSAAFLFITLLLSKNLGATGITILLLGPVFLFTRRMQLVFAGLIAVVVISYPMLRAAQIIPTERLVAIAMEVNPDRAKSLETRFRNENNLLARAEKKPIAGWGIWGRARIYDENTGRDLSVTDGSWIILFGNHGWIGYLTLFGLLCLIPIRMALRAGSLPVSNYDSALVLVLTAGLIDQLPNTSLVTPLWLITGVLWGRYTDLRQNPTQPEATQNPVDGRRSGRVDRKRRGAALQDRDATPPRGGPSRGPTPNRSIRARST